MLVAHLRPDSVGYFQAKEDISASLYAGVMTGKLLACQTQKNADDLGKA